MTVSRSQPNLAQRLQDHATSDHERGCMGRQYSCSCGYDATTEKLLIEAAEHIRGLEGALKDWLSFAEEELSEFDVEECTSDHLCPKCERSGCINMKIADTRAALSHAGPVARDGER